MNPRDELVRLVDANGGSAVWRRLESLTIDMDRLDGPLLAMKGLGRSFSAFRHATIRPRQQRVEFADYPAPGGHAVFDRGRVQLWAGAAEPYIDRSNYRHTFAGLRKYRRWTPADVVFFFGYALTMYASVPFVFPDYAHEVSPWSGGLMVTVRFPRSFETHSSLQRFWFDWRGRLARHDYRADVVGWWAWAAHFTSDYVVMNGLPIATRRRVVVRLGRLATPIPVLNADLRPVNVRLRA